MKLIKNLFFSLIILLSYQSKAQNNFSTSELESFKKSFVKHVMKKMKKHDVTGLSVAVEIENHLILEEGFGFSDKSKNIKATKDTEYPIGSVSKIITSTAILKLYSDGLIDIEKPYIDYVKDFSMKSHFKDEKGFTIKQLLSHYAGIPRLRAKGFMKKKPESIENLLKKSKEEYLIASPGKVYQYSDWGVDLLSLLVERVSGTTYEDYVEKNIFKPLQMNHSYFGPAKHTKGYKKGKEIETYNYSYSGSDGVTSSASDMLKIIQLYTNKGKSFNKQFISSDIASEAIKQQFVDAELAFDTEVGFMWDVRKLKNGYTRVKKAGIHEPFFTYIFSIPEFGASIVICSNSNSSSSVHWDSWSKLFGFLGKKHSFPNFQGAIKKKRKAKKIKLTEDQFNKIEGSYSTSFGILDLKRNGNKFDVNFSLENKKGVGIPYNDGLIKLYVKVIGVKIHAMDVFWKEVDGEIIFGEQFKNGARRVSGAKIESKEIPVSWKNAVGIYEVENYDENDYKTFDKIKLFINPRGILEISANIDFPNKIEFQLGLSPTSDELAIIPGYNFDFFGGETVKLKKTEKTYYLTLSGYKFRRIE